MNIDRIIAIGGIITLVGSGLGFYFAGYDDWLAFGGTRDVVIEEPWLDVRDDERVWVGEQMEAHIGAGHNVSGDISSALAGPQVQIENINSTLIRLNEQLDLLNSRMGEANVKIGVLGTEIGAEVTNLRNLGDDVEDLSDDLDDLDDHITEISNRPWVRAPIAGQ